MPNKFARFVLVVAALLALIGAGSWRLLHSSVFSVHNVQVRGVDGINADSVRQAAALDGQHYFSIDAAAAVQRVDALPWVKSATVTTSFPNGATISVSARTPIGVWRVGGVNYLVAGDGVVIGTTDDGGGLPLVDASDGTAVQIGERIDPDPLVVAAAVDDFASANLQQTVSQISYARDTGVTVVAAHGVQVLLGDSTGLEHKLAVWQAVVGQTKSSELHVLDLRGERPYYR